MQRGLVSEQAADDRLVALAAYLEAVKPGGPPAVQDTCHAYLITGRSVGERYDVTNHHPLLSITSGLPAQIALGCLPYLWTLEANAGAGHHPKVAWEWNLAVMGRGRQRNCLGPPEAPEYRHDVGLRQLEVPEW